MTGSMRLPGGGRIDRSRPLKFTFNGKGYTGYEGDTLASALIANGVHLIARSMKYHRPRGLMTAGSDEPNGMVQLATGARTEPNIKATQIPLIEDALQAYPDIKYIGGIAPAIEGGIQVLKEKGRDDIKLVAENTMLATVTSLKPGKMIRYQGELTRQVTVSVRGFGDEVTSFKLPWSLLKDMRAFAAPAGWIPGLDRPLIIFNRLAFAESASLGLRGELWHELVHNTVRQLRRSPLTLPLWRRLVDHVNGLRVLDMSQQQYYAGIRHPSATRALTDETMRDLYKVQYANRLDFQDMIDEESVAHFVELWRHGQWPKMDIEPVADLLSALEKGASAPRLPPR